MIEPTSTIYLSKSALQNNIDFLKNYLGSDCELCSVVKGNAYGHHIETFGPLAVECGIERFAVFSAYEAYRLYEVIGNNASVMIMGMIADDELEWCIQQNISFFVFDVKRAEDALKVAKKLSKKARIHIDVETGFHRTGLETNELQHVSRLILTNPEYFHVEGLCTHFAGAESIINDQRVNRQFQRYQSIRKGLQQQGIHAQFNHVACSAGAFNYPESIMDLARIGIMQYGFWSSQETFRNYASSKKTNKDPLKRVISWKSRVMSTKKIQEGDYVGYGKSFLSETERKIALVPVGYAEGYTRALSNKGKVLIHGKRLDVIGIVNMNVMIVDINNVPEVKIGDEAVLIGHQGKQEITVAAFTDLSNELNYELLTRLPMDIPRIVTD